jgi:cytochrome bd-type quinol oxidase subunit 1
MVSSPVTLDRWQFTLTVMLHYLFPILTMGLSLYVLWFVTVATFGREGRWLRPSRKTPAARAAHDRAAHFWAKIFAVSFGSAWSPGSRSSSSSGRTGHRSRTSRAA